MFVVIPTLTIRQGPFTVPLLFSRFKLARVFIKKEAQGSIASILKSDIKRTYYLTDHLPRVVQSIVATVSS
jgi:hypothetical protein